MAYFETIKVEGFMQAIEAMHYLLPKKRGMDSYIDEKTNEFILGYHDSYYNNYFKEIESWTYTKHIHVWVKIKAPLYWWEDFSKYYTYIGMDYLPIIETLIQKEEITLTDIDYPQTYLINNNILNKNINEYLTDYLSLLNEMIKKYKKAHAIDNKTVLAYQLDSFIPRGYKDERIVCIDYNILSVLYSRYLKSDIDHWSKDFINWAKNLPYASNFIIKDLNASQNAANRNFYNMRKDLDINTIDNEINNYFMHHRSNINLNYQNLSTKKEIEQQLLAIKKQNDQDIQKLNSKIEHQPIKWI